MVQLIAVCVVDARDQKWNHSWEESDGRDYSMVQRLIVITLNERQNLGHYSLPIGLLHCCDSATDLLHQNVTAVCL